MVLKSVTEGETRFLLAGVLALMAQGAWSESNNDAQKPAVAATETVTVTAAAERPIEVDVRAHIDALNKRLVDELSRQIKALDANRSELVIAEVPTRG
jgi:predicted metalloprotease